MRQGPVANGNEELASAEVAVRGQGRERHREAELDFEDGAGEQDGGPEAELGGAGGDGVPVQGGVVPQEEDDVVEPAVFGPAVRGGVGGEVDELIDGREHVDGVPVGERLGDGGGEKERGVGRGAKERLEADVEFEVRGGGVEIVDVMAEGEGGARRDFGGGGIAEGGKGEGGAGEIGGADEEIDIGASAEIVRLVVPFAKGNTF